MVSLWDLTIIMVMDMATAITGMGILTLARIIVGGLVLRPY